MPTLQSFFPFRSKLLHTAARFPGRPWEQGKPSLPRLTLHLKLRIGCTGLGAIIAPLATDVAPTIFLSVKSAALMWIERLLDGVLRVLTLLGPRYLSPSFLERVYLLWTFRNFTSLPLVVLNHRQQKLVDRLCSQQELLSLPYGMFEQPLIGTVERLSPMHSHVETQAEGALSSLAASGLLPHSSSAWLSSRVP